MTTTQQVYAEDACFHCLRRYEHIHAENARLKRINSDLLKVLKGTLKSLKNDIFDWPTYSEDDERLLAWLKEAFTEVGARIKEAIAKAEGDAR